MPRGVRGSGTAHRVALSPDEARREREKLQARLAELEVHDARRYALVGRVVLQLAESDAAFSAQLRGILERGVTDRHERLALGLDELIKPSGRGRGRRRAAGSQAGMQGPNTASTESTEPTGPAEETA